MEITAEVPQDYKKQYLKKIKHIDNIMAKAAKVGGREADAIRKTVLGYCADPTLFAYVHLRDKKNNRYKPFDYQDMILNDQSKNIIVVKGRQIGITDVLSIKAFHTALFNQNTTVCVVSKTQPMAKRIIDRIREFRMNTPFGEELAKTGVDNKFELWIKRTVEVPVANRMRKKQTISKIISVVAGDSARGESVNHLYLDEAAFIGDSIDEGDYIYNEVLRPTTMATDGKIMLVSTPPKIPAGFFYEIWKGGANWKRYHFPSNISPLMKPKDLQERKDEMLDAAYRREYLGEFLANENCVFSEQEIQEAVDKNLNFGGITKEQIYIGVDWGETQANSAYAVVKATFPRVPDQANVQVLDLKEYPLRTDYMVIIKDISNLCKRYNVRMILADKGIGGGQISVMSDMGLPVEGYSFSGGTRKADLVTTSKILFEKRRIKMPYHKQLMQELGAYQQEYNMQTTRTKFYAPVTGKIRDHLLDAFMLANFAAVGLSGPPAGALVVGEAKKKQSKYSYVKKMECNSCACIFEGDGLDRCPYCDSRRIEEFK